MRILDDNGAPMSGRSLVLSSAANANLLGKQPAFHKVNEAGTDMMRRRAMYEAEFGAYVGVSRQLKEHVASTGVAGVLVNLSGGVPVGTTAIPVDGAGAGETLQAGDFVTLASDENKYVSAAAKIASFTTLDIGKPGLEQAASNNTAITVGGDYTPSVATPSAVTRFTWPCGFRPCRPKVTCGTHHDAARSVQRHDVRAEPLSPVSAGVV